MRKNIKYLKLICTLVLFLFFLLLGKQTAAEKSTQVNPDADIARSSLNIKKYGAIGDGVSDDTVSIQDAFNELANGQSLYFPPGNYKINDTLQFYGKQNIGIIGHEAKIIMTNNTKNIMRLGNGAGGASIRYHISGLDINGGSTSGYAIGVDTGGGTYMQNCIIQDCQIYNCNTGIYLGGDYNVILNNTFESCTKAGILNDCSSYALIEGNTFKTCFNSINLQLPYYNEVLNNHVIESSNFGILVGGTAKSEVHCLIANNIILGANNLVVKGLTGIWIVAGVGKVEINNNLVAYCGQHGIKSLGNDVSIISNRCYNNNVSGIIVDNCSRNSLIGNKCYDNGHDGIDIVNRGSNHLILNNQCYDDQMRKTQGYGLVIAATQFGCLVQGNEFLNNKLDGVSDGTYNHSKINYSFNVDGRT
ncbi:right-handed parallel beta-helix repeat-containing protein [Desulfosporosinus sp. OT]|uniref:right-handed parallel beta-helix repeat-containing protein n=1 Tax=Desulfosporosinus sp. OT TaxID=913865 RepID=UPI000223A92D|nr:right-handed parallel beta-helix repeat-containing protein [Desulfosporosinus sp. OT]EGW38463.1 hypothetical protein DOT_3747 [Desulfosporosinus sp. OT]